MRREKVDWEQISRRFQQIMSAMTHEERWNGPDFYGEALRRTFGFVAAGEPAYGRAFPYDQLTSGYGLTTLAEADHVRDAHTVMDRLGREDAEKKVEEIRVELARVYREAGSDLAQMLRARCNDRTVPSRYRREGVAWAADMIDPAVPKDRFGNLARPAADADAPRA